MVYLTRKIEFSASHLYHNPAFSPEANRRIFGKCNYPGGHGHNYVLEVTVGGEADPQTGMVLDLQELKQILETEIMERMDHRFLNYEVVELAGQIPTCENVAAVIWRLLEPQINKKITRGRLHRVRLWESPELYVDCYGKEMASADPSANNPGRGMTGLPMEQPSQGQVGAKAAGGGLLMDQASQAPIEGKAEAGADPPAQKAGRGMTSKLADQESQGLTGAKQEAVVRAEAKSNGAHLSLTRRYGFAASHRLHSAHLDEAANQRVYGKCNNPYGHGHNYVVEVTLSGTPDRATGMIAHLEELDRFVEREVLEPFDHKYLNEDVPVFRERVPTTENLCIEIFDRLKRFPGARLERIRVEETGRNSFEYRG